MIQVKFELSENRKNIRLTLQGHAGQAEEGKDIVCSAASILAYTVAQTITILFERGRIPRKPMIRLDKGDILVQCRPSKSGFDQAMHTYAVAQVGFSLLARDYPEYVSLTPFDTGKQP